MINAVKRERRLCYNKVCDIETKLRLINKKTLNENDQHKNFKKRLANSMRGG